MSLCELEAAGAAARPVVAPVREPEHWVFAKLFFERDADVADQIQAADQLLVGTLAQQFEAFRAARLPYFFIRYQEGGYHLRIRVHGQSRRMRQQLRQTLTRTLEPQLKRGAQLAFARYEPELGKYAGRIGNALAELHFGSSSDVAVMALRAAPGQRMRIALQLLQETLEAAELEPQQQIDWCQAYYLYWGGQFRLLRAALNQDKAQYLAQAQAIRASLEVSTHKPAVRECLIAWADVVRRDCQWLREAERRGELLDPMRERDPLHQDFRDPLTLLSLLPNFVHMLNNRMGVTIRQEMRLSYCLLRELARRHQLRPRPLRISLIPT